MSKLQEGIRLSTPPTDLVGQANRFLNLRDQSLNPVWSVTIGRMNCSRANALFDDYADAAIEHFGAVDMLSNLVDSGSREGFGDAKWRVELTYMQCRATRLALEKHRLEHDCLVAGAAGES